MLVQYFCEKCKTSKTKFYSRSKKVLEEISCCEGGKLERQLSSPSTKSTSIIDNGIMQKKVEVSNNILEKERNILKKRGEI